jgi:hypothetical protein
VFTDSVTNEDEITVNDYVPSIIGLIEVARRGQPFLPSRELVTLFERGIMAAIELARLSPEFTRTTLHELDRRELKSADDLASLLRAQLLQFFALFASQGRARNLKGIRVTEEGGFSLPFEHAISTNFLIRPVDLSDFLRLLVNELRTHVEDGGRFGGSWGQLVLRNGDLFLFLLGDRLPSYPAKQKARLIKDIQ